MGIGLGSLQMSAFGISAWGSLALGVGGILGLSLGTTLVLINCVAIVLMFWRKRKLIGIGTIIGSFLIGYVADFLIFAYGLVEFDSSSLITRIVLMVAGIVLMALGASLSITAALGVSAYDGVSLVAFADIREKIQYRWVRVLVDITSVTLGILLGAIVGVATVLVAAFTGPLISFFKASVAVPVLNKFS